MSEGRKDDKGKANAWLYLGAFGPALARANYSASIQDYPTSLGWAFYALSMTSEVTWFVDAVRVILARHPGILDEVILVGELGAAKYLDDSNSNWRHVPDAYVRYRAAAYRHYSKVLSQGEHSVNEEGGQRHLAHMVWNLLACITLYELGAKDTKGTDDE